MQTARNLAEQLLGLAQRAQDPGLLLQAYHALGTTYELTGAWASAHAHLEQGIALYDPQQHGAHAFLYGGHDPGVCCQCFSARSLWILGYPAQALKRSREALTLARELSHPTSLAHARFQLGMFHQFRRDGSETQEQAEALEALSLEHELPFYLAAGLVVRGWALAQRGQAEEGLARIRQGLAAWATSGLALHWHAYSLALLAEVYDKAGKAAEGLAVLGEALRAVEETGIRSYEPEMHRLQGELLLTHAAENQAAAEACFQQAIAIAHRQGAKSWELRNVLSLSRLYHQQGKQEEARQMLAEIYGWFTEGFDTADLQEARALLEALSR